MFVIRLIEPLLRFSTPLTSPLLALVIALALPLLRKRVRSQTTRWIAGAGLVAVCFALYHFAAISAAADRWLSALNSPIFAVFLVIILPAMYLPRNRWYKLFLILPSAFVALMVLAVFDAYRSVPAGSEGFYWFLIRPAYLMAGVVSLLVLIQPLVSLKWFRPMVRFACLLVLVYGGFALRQDYSDYQAMVKRRPDARQDVMTLAETSPVVQSDQRMLHLPAAPCRFTADGGYVQGCNLELLQRLLQLDTAGFSARDPAVLGVISVLLGAVTLFLTLCFISARWTCGWLCPLSTLGGVFDWVRRKLGMPHLKPAQPVKVGLLFSGIGISSIALLMAKLYPHLDANGKFAGCKIPLYPFCKICPSQQICPVAAGGPKMYAGLPTADWGWGFFRYGSIALLSFFAFAFITSRRLWCRFCPMGMISGLFNRGGMMRLRKDAGKCNRCGICAEVCPMDIDIVRSEMEKSNVTTYDCVLCLKCLEKCPRDGCLSLEHGGVKVTESRFQK